MVGWKCNLVLVFWLTSKPVQFFFDCKQLSYSTDLKSRPSKFCMVKKRLVCSILDLELDLKFESLTIWNPDKCLLFGQKLFEIWTKVIEFRMVPFSNGQDHWYSRIAISIAWNLKLDQLKTDLQKSGFWMIEFQIPFSKKQRSKCKRKQEPNYITYAFLYKLKLLKEILKDFLGRGRGPCLPMGSLRLMPPWSFQQALYNPTRHCISLKTFTI